MAHADTYTILDQGIPTVIYKSVKLGHTSPTKVIHLNINLAPSSSGALEAYANSVSSPKSPLYHKFLTPEQIGAQFGQSTANLSKVISFLRGHGLTVKVAAKNRFNIMVDGTVAATESAFKTEIDDFQTLSKIDPENQKFYSNTTKIQIPVNLKGIVRSISGLQSHSKPKPMVAALTPDQARNVYGVAPLYGSNFQGQGMNVAITSFDGFSLSNVPIFETAFNLPFPAAGRGSNIKVITVDGGSQGGPQQGEADLDIQMVLGQAPLCNFYVYDGGANLTDVLTQEANDNVADIISESYGFNVSTEDALACHIIHLAMTAQGITYMGATGDNGTDFLGFDYPNFDPEVLKVGGTIANLDSAGNRITEVTWSGGGSGWSTRTDSFNTLPSWQVGTGVPVGNNHRLVPDVAINAAGSNTGAYQFVFKGSLSSDYDGTSFACPVFAGGLAVAEQKLIALGSLVPNGTLRARYGRIQDVIYGEKQRSDVWFDIVNGPSTGTLPDGTTAVPGPGWDYTTGMGAINWDGFVIAEAAPPVTVAPISVTPLVGNYLSGSKTSLISVDGSSYEMATSEYPGVGQAAAMTLTFALPTTDPTKVSSMYVSATTLGNDLSTSQIFVYNLTTGRYDLLQSFPGSLSMVENKVYVASPINYVSNTGKVQVVIRSLAPDRLNTGGYTFATDQAIVGAKVLP